MIRLLLLAALLGCGPPPKLNREDGGVFNRWWCPTLTSACTGPPGWCAWCTTPTIHPDGTCHADLCLCKPALPSGACPDLFP